MANLEKMFEPYVCKGLPSLICKKFQKQRKNNQIALIYKDFLKTAKKKTWQRYE